MTADETHHMTEDQIAGFKVFTSDRMPPSVVVFSTAHECQVVSVPSADPVALALEKRRQDRERGERRKRDR